eukprot:scaffold3451_cov116-Isochrysis_galbana.AAC.11
MDIQVDDRYAFDVLMVAHVHGGDREVVQYCEAAPERPVGVVCPPGKVACDPVHERESGSLNCARTLQQCPPDELGPACFLIETDAPSLGGRQRAQQE